MLIGVFFASDISYGLRVPLNTWKSSRDDLNPEFTYYTRDEDGKLLKEPCGFPGRWTVELKIPIKDDTNASVQRMVKSFSLSMHSSGRQDVKKAKFTVVKVLPKEQKGILARGKDFYIMSSDKFGIEVVLKASFLKKGISGQRAIFSKIAPKIPQLTDLIMPKTAKPGKKIRKVLVINAFMIDRGFSKLNSTSLALASLLKEHGYNVGISNVEIEGNNIKVNQKELESADIVCITAYDQQLSYIREFTDFLKRINQNIIIVMGGPLLTIAPEHAFSHLPSVDIFYRGEAEVGFVDALEDLENLNFESMPGTPGLTVHKRDTYYFNDFISVNRMTPDQLNKRPFDFSFLNQDNLGGAFVLMTSLGCPYACIFCAAGGGKPHRAMDPKNVIEIARKYQKRLEELKAEDAVIPDDAWNIVFSDDDFLRNPDRALEILESWRKAKLRIKIATFETRLQSFLVEEPGTESKVNIKLIDSIASFKDIFSHVFRIQIGTDALIDSEIRGLNKGPYNERLIEEVMAELGNRRIFNEHFLILTNPDTALEDLMRTLLKASIFEIRYPYTFFSTTSVIETHIGTSVVNKLIEDSRESLIIPGEIIRRYNRIPGFKEYDFYGERSVINPGNVPPDVFGAFRHFFKAQPLSRRRTGHFMLECLHVLAKECQQAKIKTRIFEKDLEELAMLEDKIDQSLKGMLLETLQFLGVPDYKTLQISL